jgi:hypothetical protein
MEVRTNQITGKAKWLLHPLTDHVMDMRGKDYKA